MLIFLIGARGSGKTTAGKALARNLDWEFIDLDEELCRNLGQTIDSFVKKEGWPTFRERESQCLRRTCENLADRNCVLATGGGLPLDQANRIFMRQNGLVIWLNAAPQDMVERMRQNPLHSQRPPLTKKSLAEEVEKVCREREPVYRDCCHEEVNGSQNPDAVCASLLTLLKKQISGA